MSGSSHGHGPGGEEHHHGGGERLGDGSLQGEDFEPGLGHAIDLNVLRNVLITLLVLTVITVAASRVNFGSWNVIIAVVIATIKATIVATFFMHLKFEGKTILMYVFYPLIVLFLLIGGTFQDVADRHRLAPFDGSPAPNKVVIPNLGHGEHGQSEHGEGNHSSAAGAGHDAAPGAPSGDGTHH